MGYRQDHFKDGELVYSIDTRVLSEEKAKLIDDINQEICRILTITDWQVVRAMDLGIPLPEEVDNFRTAIRLQNALMNAAIENINTVDELGTFNWKELVLSITNYDKYGA